MGMMLSQEEAKQIGGAYFDRIASVIDGAFDDYLRSLYSISSIGIMTDLNLRTSASFVHDMIAQRLKLEFSKDKDVKVGDYGGILGLVISGKIFIRFKKLNSDLKTSNVATEQAEQFNKQQLELPGFGRLTLLTAGYLLNRSGTAIRNIYLTCRRDNAILWCHDLRGESGMTPLFGPELTPNGGPKAPTDQPALVVLKGGRNNTSQTAS